MIDTHAHIYLPQFDEDIEEVIQRMKAEGVERVYLPNIDVESVGRLKKLSERYPETFYPMMGLHPCSVKEDYEQELKAIEKEFFGGDYIGVGEIGVDLYWDTSFMEEQKHAFRKQIKWAEELQLPYVVHSRDSLDMTIGISAELQNGNHHGIFHCFNGTLDQARRIMDIGFYLGIGGVVTFKNAGVDKVIKDIPLENIVLETDSPYLSPAPFRGKRNEPSYLKYIVNKIAEIKQIDNQEVIEVTTRNALKLFYMDSHT